MSTDHRTDIETLEAAFDAAERDAHTLVAGLPEELGGWRATPEAWSVSQCLEHLATANRLYLSAMRPAAERAFRAGRRRRRAIQPGVLGGWFVRSLEPPVNPRRRGKAPKSIQPRPSPPLHEAIGAFLESQDEVRFFLRTYSGTNLAGVRFPNPFIRSLRFSLATGLHVIAAHERRHLWQAWRVREAAERAIAA